jgi:hypothetical protein
VPRGKDPHLRIWLDVVDDAGMTRETGTSW